jgi:hypothetical protein
MAINEDVEAYLRGLYPPESVEFPPDLTPMPMALEERPRFRNMLEGEVDPVTGETVRPSALQRIRETAEIGAEQNRREADLLAEQAALSLFQGGGMEAAEAPAGERVPLPRGMPQPPPDMGYLDALTQAQRQDDLAASLRRLNDPAEQLARIQSRGIYQPMGLAAAPSAVSQLQQRQQAVADFIRQQREAERAPLELDLLRAQAERQRRPAGGIVETEALKRLREATAKQREAQAEAALKPKPVRPAAKRRDFVAEKKADYERRLKEGIPVGYELRPGSQPTVQQRQDAAKLTVSGDVVRENLDGIRELLSSPMAVANPATRQLLAQQGQFIKTQLRVLEDLGVPSGPDAKILDQLIGDPQSLTGELIDSTRQKLDALQKYVAARVQATTFRYGLQPTELPPKAAAPAAEMPAATSALPEDKRKRLEELRRKRDEGTLGR